MAKPPPKYPQIKNPSTRVYWDDWAGDKRVRMCGLAARGLWFEMLAIMAAAGGYLALDGKPLSRQQLAGLIGQPADLVSAAWEELSTNEVFSVDRIGTPYNRRMARTQKVSQIRAKSGQKGGIAKSLNSQRDLDFAKQTSSKHPSKTLANGDPRARPLQDSPKNQNIIHTGEKNPASANGHAKPLQPGAVMKRIIRTLELRETTETRRYAIALQDDMTPAELHELHDPATDISRVTAILSRVKSIHIGS